MIVSFLPGRVPASLQPQAPASSRSVSIATLLRVSCLGECPTTDTGLFQVRVHCEVIARLFIATLLRASCLGECRRVCCHSRRPCPGARSLRGFRKLLAGVSALPPAPAPPAGPAPQDLSHRRTTKRFDQKRAPVAPRPSHNKHLRAAHTRCSSSRSSSRRLPPSATSTPPPSACAPPSRLAQ